jgi:hypothetical protein
MSRGTAFAKIAAMAQLLDDIGLHDDATVMDELLEAAMEPGLHKEAGMWQAILSRLSGWARKVLFTEYRQMYEAAKSSQEKASARLKELQDVNDELKEMLARHMLPDWRDGMTALLPAMSMSVDKILSIYDEQHAKMTARLLKLTPKAKKEEGKKEAPEPIIPPLMPKEEKEEKKETPLETAVEKALKPTETPAGTPEDPIPLTTKKPSPATPAPEAPAPEAVPPTPPLPPPPPVAEPLAGWKKERFGSSGKHGWEWEWEISPDGNKLRLPTSQLAAASSGKGKILHGRDGRYRPTGGTSSLKLRKLMGGVFWEEEDDPSAPGMSILVRTEDAVPPPLSIRQEPVEQTKKLKDLGKTSAERMECLIALATDLIGEEVTDEEKLEEAAQVLLRQFEAEEMDEEEI